MDSARSESARSPRRTWHSAMLSRLSAFQVVRVHALARRARHRRRALTALELLGRLTEEDMTNEVPYAQRGSKRRRWKADARRIDSVVDRCPTESEIRELTEVEVGETDHRCGLSAVGFAAGREEDGGQHGELGGSARIERSWQGRCGYPSASSRARWRPRRWGRSWAKRCTPAKIESGSRWASAITSASVPPVSHTFCWSAVRE